MFKRTLNSNENSAPLTTFLQPETKKQVLQCQVEEHGLLTHEANLFPPPTHVQLFQVAAPHRDEPLLRIIEPPAEVRIGITTGGMSWSRWDASAFSNITVRSVHHFQK